jgi:hypothetical protein
LPSITTIWSLSASTTPFQTAFMEAFPTWGEIRVDLRWLSMNSPAGSHCFSPADQAGE